MRAPAMSGVLQNGFVMELTSSAGDAHGRPVARTAFVLLFLLMVINHVDRQVVVSMFVPLKAAWGLSDGALGLLVSVTSIAVAVCAVPVSMLADRWNRVRIISAMALLWSLATIACAFAPTYATLLGTRALVGVGEAAYGAVGVALLAALFPPDRRGTVFGAFFVATILGAALGVALGGIFVELMGWRWTFVAAGVPGIVLALGFYARMPRTSETGQSMRIRAAPPPIHQMLGDVLRSRTLVWACIGAGFQLLPVAMTYAWLPTYFTRAYGLDVRTAGLVTGVFVLVTGVGIVSSGALADWLARRVPRGRLYVPLAGALFTFASLTSAFAIMAPGSGQLALFAVCALVMTSSVGPLSAVVLDVTHVGVRATAAATLALVQNLFGLAGGPVLAGFLSDRYGLHTALALIPALSLPAALCFWWASRTYVQDTRRALRQVAAGPTADR